VIVWLKSLAFKALATIVMMAVAYGAGYLKASLRCQAQAELTTLKSQLATAQADLGAAKQAEDNAAKKAKDLQAQADAHQDLIDDLEDDLARQTGRAPCNLSDADALRLRNIK